MKSRKRRLYSAPVYEGRVEKTDALTFDAGCPTPCKERRIVLGKGLSRPSFLRPYSLRYNEMTVFKHMK
jgi:hypothetical protein